MERATKKVVGKYRTPEDVKATLQRLERAGYKREDITLYTDNSNLNEFEEKHDLDMLADKTVEVHDDSKDSFWDKVKHMVSYDDADDDLTEEDDEFLEPYREDIKAGYTIVAVREEMYERATAEANEPVVDPDIQNEIESEAEPILVDEELLDEEEERETDFVLVGDDVTADAPVTERDLVKVEEKPTDLTVVDKIEDEIDGEMETVEETERDVDAENAKAEEPEITFEDPTVHDDDLHFEERPK